MLVGVSESDQMDLLEEQVKMLAGEIALSTSTLKRLVEQSVNDPDGNQLQIQNLESEIQEKRRQMRALEKHIMESGEASMANASIVDMQRNVMKLMTQCNEKGFELEIKSADNRILQEQLQNKCAENKELQDKLLLLQQQLNSVNNFPAASGEHVSAEYVDELKRKIQSQEVENERLKLEHVRLVEENSGMTAHNQKLAEEASYAKELASAAAIELKNLAGEVTKLSLQNARQAKELLAAQEMAYSRGSHVHMGSGGIRKHFESKIDGGKMGRKGRPPSRGGETPSTLYDDAEFWDLDLNDMKMELQARKQREAALESALAEKELAEDDYRRKIDEAKKREAALENDLAGMWVLVAKLKRAGGVSLEVNADDRAYEIMDLESDLKESNYNGGDVLIDRQASDDSTKPLVEQTQNTELEPLVVRLKARMREMKEKEQDSLGNGDANSHICKVCFEAPTAAILLPCRHFCWDKLEDKDEKLKLQISASSSKIIPLEFRRGKDTVDLDS
ncbi:hypothetical protein ACLOJK_027798 [Asimina triloba]